MNQNYHVQNRYVPAEVSADFLFSLMNIHSLVSGYYLNLSTGRLYAISQEKTYSDRYNAISDWKEFDNYIRDCVHPDDQAALTEASRISYISQRLQKEDSFYIDIRDLATGYERWFRYTTTRGADKDHVAICFRDITDFKQKSKELENLNRQLEENQTQLEEATAEQEAQIEEITALNDEIEASKEHLAKAFAVADALSSSFRDVYLLDKDKRTLLIRKQKYVVNGAEILGNDLYSYDTFVDSYIENRVYRKDKPFVTKALSLDNVIENVRKNGRYNVTYRVLENGEKHFYEGVYTNVDAQYIVCAFQNIDDTIAREKEFNDIIANAGFGVWHIYLKEGVAPRMKANEKMAELLGIDTRGMSEEDIYHAWYGRITPDAIPSVQESVGEMMAGKFSENTYLWNHPAKGDIYVRCGGTSFKLDDGTFVLRGYHADVTDIVEKEEDQKVALQKKNEEITALNEEQMAQIEEIKALNQQLEENEAELEKEKDKAEAERARVAEAYGMISGLSQEYHTIWIVSKDTSKMRLIRTSGVSTIKNAVQMGKDFPEFDVGFERYINTYVEPEDRERMHKEIAFAEVLRQLEKVPLYAVNYLRRDANGNVGYHQIAFANADTEDGKKQFVYGFRDIDKLVKEEEAQKEELRKAKEDADAANQAKTSFLFNMSHDIRTPMNAIIGFRDMLEKHQEDPVRRKDYLDKIQDASSVLLSIINNVLEMARIEKGRVEIEEKPTDVSEFVGSLYTVFHEMMQMKGIELTQRIDIIHQYVMCDTTKLHEVFFNILSNACKYTKDGGKVDMTVEEIPSGQKGYARYRTTISDTGIGMSEEFLPHLFEEFSREENTTKSKVQGTGLGMPIVKRLVDLMGGTIEVKSKKGVGSTFIVTLTSRIAHRSELPEQTEAKPVEISLEGKRILLVEDNALNAEIATDALEEAGVKVEHANDGLICCKIYEDAEENYYDLILMDIQMPHMNGYEATKVIRKMENPVKAGIPIIAMTANAFEEDKRAAYEAGMNGHLAKPIKVRTLIREISEVLAQFK